MNKFDKEFTRKERFHINRTTSAKVPMMCIEEEPFFYMKMRELDAELIVLPYEVSNCSVVIPCLIYGFVLRINSRCCYYLKCIDPCFYSSINIQA